MSRRSLPVPATLTKRADRIVVRRLLAEAGIDARSPLGIALARLLMARIDGWRDFFALRRGGQRMRQSVLVVMASRSLADDRDAAASLPGLGVVRGAALLHAIEELVVATLAPNCRRSKSSALASVADEPQSPRELAEADARATAQVKALSGFVHGVERRRASQWVAVERRARSRRSAPERLAA